MLEKLSQMAERMATNASRRQFLVRLGQAAAGAAGFLGGGITHAPGCPSRQTLSWCDVPSRL